MAVYGDDMAARSTFARPLMLLEPRDDCTSCSRRTLEVVTDALGAIWGL